MAAHSSPGRGSDSDTGATDTNAGSSPRGYNKGIFSLSTFSADSLTVSVQPMCAVSNTHQHICALVKNPSHSPSLIGLLASVDVKQQKINKKCHSEARELWGPASVAEVAVLGSRP